MNRQQILNEQASLTQKHEQKEITPREYVSEMTRLRSELSIVEKKICDDYDRIVLENGTLKSENGSLKSENATLKSEIYKLQSQSISVGKPWIYIEDSQLINEYNSGMNILEMCL